MHTNSYTTTVSFRVQILKITIASFALVCQAIAGDLPDNRVTPGAINPDVTQENIQKTICVPRYTKTIRPPAYYTNKIKRTQLEGDYRGADQNLKHFEEDHLIALSIGGNPTDIRNLWAEPRKSEWSAEKKDQLEFVLHRLVCRGEVSLQNAQLDMASDWIAAFKKYVPSHSEIRYRGDGD